MPESFGANEQYKFFQIQLYRIVLLKSDIIGIKDEQNNQDFESLQQAVEVIELYLNVWNQEIDYEETDALISAILNDQIEERDRIAARMHTNLSQIHTMWILRQTGVSDGTTGGSRRQSHLRMLQQFLKEHHKLVVVDQYEENLVAFLDESMFEESEVMLANEFIKQLEPDHIHIRGVVCQGLINPAQIRASYLISNENLQTAPLIYRAKSIFTLGEIHFAARCREILAQGESAVEERLHCFDKMQNLLDREDLLQTLSVYLLDADSSTQKTGALLFLHRNTVKYRLAKIRSAFGHELTRMPELLELYLGVALRRLLRHKE